jgi:hypothetical protein
MFDLKPISGYPALSERACGWLRFLYRKMHVSDDWSRNGQPSEVWDRSSTPPMMSFPRFDLLDSSYAVTPWPISRLRGVTCIRPSSISSSRDTRRGGQQSTGLPCWTTIRIG